MNCQESNLVVARILLFRSGFFRDPGQKVKIVVTFLIALRYINSVRKFKAFYNKYKDMFFAYLMRSTGDYYLASDIMQESFTRYLERYGKGPESAALLIRLTITNTISWCVKNTGKYFQPCRHLKPINAIFWR